MNLSPLGSGALAGSGFPFDREAMAADGDPIAKARLALVASGAAGDAELDGTEAAARAEMAEALAAVRAAPAPDPGEALTDVFATPREPVR